jgi:hypothetical protein
MDWPNFVMPPPPIFSTAHMIAPTVVSANPSGFTPLGNVVSAAWTAANYPVLVPFTLTNWVTVYAMLWYVGSTQSGNIDMGVYDSKLVRIIATGSTALGTVSTVQQVDCTDTPLAPGRYYFAMCADSTAVTYQRCMGVTMTGQAAGFALPIYDTISTAFPLPNPMSTLATPPANNTPAFVPICALQLRSVM